MAEKDPELVELEGLRLRLAAQKWITRLEERRLINRAASASLAPDKIAGFVGIPVDAVVRALRTQIDLEVQPREIILRALATGSNRSALVDELGAMTYTVGETPPPWQEGRVQGTWDQVLNSFMAGYLSEEELEEIRQRTGME